MDIDEETLEQVRTFANEQGTSVDVLVREYLESFANPQQRQIEVMERILKLANEARAGSGPEGRVWTREDVYDDAIKRRS